ncbi:MAG: M14 family metallopeptidase [Planctomycetota bacterium]|nr:M14 family metallopeptidase [Planctomycetota bacterium]MDA1248661.1 M14 family metallopeptidase [Planctomycetota bacterium]
MTISLRTFHFSGLESGPRLLVTGGVHGDEFEPIAAIRRLIALFESESKVVAGFRGEVVFVPVVNEAAFLRGHRCAEDGLDLARTCPGDSNGTVTEQKAAALSELIRSADFYIDLHTGGTEYSVTPLAGYSMHRDSRILEVQRRMAKAFNLPVVWGTAGDLDGRSLSVARDASVPAIYCEYLGSATCSESGVEDYVAGCLNVMRELGLLDRPLPECRVEHVIEDPTPGSGHMQVCNPSLVTGYFETAVEVGDVISSGGLLGTVYDLESHSPHEVRSPHGGIVITLRTFPRVREGESVGVVAEL